MSIKRKILISVLALIIIPSMLIGASCYILAENFLVERHIDSLNVVAQIKAHKIDSFIEQKISQLEQFSTQDFHPQFLETFLAHSSAATSNNDHPTINQQLDGQLTFNRQMMGLDSIFLANAAGKIIYINSDQKPRRALNSRFVLSPDQFGLLDAQNGVVLHFVHNEQECGQDYIFLLRPIVVGQSMLHGYLGFEVNIASLYSLIEDSTGLGQTGKTVLGKKISETHFIHLTQSIRQENFKHLDTVALSPESPMPMSEAVSGRSGCGISRNFKGTKIIASWNYIPSLDIGLVAKIDFSEVADAILPFKLTILGALSFIATLGFLAGLKLTRVAAQPIHRLKMGTDRVGAGDFSHKILIESRDEFGDLAQAFNGMTENLVKVTASRDQLDCEMRIRQEAEQKLLKSEKQLRELFDNANDLIQSISPEGNLLFVNKAWMNTLGYAAEEIDQLNIFDIIHPDHRDHCMSAFQALLQGGEGGAFESAFVTKEGRTILLEGNVSFQFENGQPIASRGIFRDITARKQAELSLDAERKFLQTIIDGVADPLFVIGLDHQILLMNKIAQQSLPDGVPELGQLMCYQASHNAKQPCCGENHPCPLKEVLQSGKVVTVTHNHEMRNGDKRTFELVASPLWADDGTLKGVIESSRDITDRVAVEKALGENEKNLQFLAHHDSLTLLPNRLMFNECLNHALLKARRSQEKVALFFLDLDRFKNINDSLGHAFGDRVLCSTAKRLVSTVRESDMVARLGGDEFLIIIEEISTAADSAHLVEKILATFNQPIVVDDQEYSLAASIGISLFPDDGDDSEELLKAADVAMYEAKKEGGNNYQFYRPVMNARTHELLVMERELVVALEEKQFVLHYQPQIDLVSGKMIAVEALVRWHHPERGLIPPGDFIPLAEQTGLIVPLGEWVLENSCQQAQAWKQQGYELPLMCVNISARQFRYGNLVEMVDNILATTGLSSERLELELTESAIMDNVEDSIMTLIDLKQRGISLSVDDFGTGYSSLSYLKRFPISKLKIDRSFVQEVSTNCNDAAIAASIIALAHSMEVDVIAEGIESDDQHRTLLSMGCQQGQGYLFSRPVAPAELTPFFK